jgi:hypothetical protein
MISVVVYIKGIQFPWFPIGFGYPGKSNFHLPFRLWTTYKKSTTFYLLIHIKINTGIIIVYRTEENPPVTLSFGYGSPGESNCNRCTMEFQLAWFCCAISWKSNCCALFAVDLRRNPITMHYFVVDL